MREARNCCPDRKLLRAKIDEFYIENVPVYYAPCKGTVERPYSVSCGAIVPAIYDIFLSHAWTDGERPRRIAEALAAAGARVWFDAMDIRDFTSITHAVSEGLMKSKALLAYYSKVYPFRRACQWELTAAFLAAQVEGDPRHRVLIINPEDRADHIYPIELRDAKCRSSPRDDVELRELVQSIIKSVATLDGPLADIDPLTTPRWYGATPVGSTHFVGRLSEMWQVHSLLHAGDVTQITGAPIASGGIGQISGLGGVGKSLLAEEYAQRFGAAYPGGIFWLRAYGNDNANPALDTEGREDARALQIRAFAEQLGIYTLGLTVAQIEGALRREIENRGQSCLWIVDDVPNGLDGEALRRWFAPHVLARTLVTTRSREYGGLAKSVDLSVLPLEDAYQLLTSRRQPLSEDEQEQAKLLAKDLGQHALAVDVTASALTSYGGNRPYRKFREDLENQEEDALELAAQLADTLPDGHEASISQTMLRSIRNLGSDGRDFLRLAPVMAVAPIPATLVSTVFEKADVLQKAKADQHQRQAFHDVTALSLAEITGKNQDSRAVHTLVSRSVRFDEKSEWPRTQELLTAAIDALNLKIAEAAEDPRLHYQIEPYLAHARHLTSSPATIGEANLVGWLGTYDQVAGVYRSAETLWTRELHFRRTVQGSKHPDSLTSMHNLASALWAQGQLERARNLEEEVLAIRLATSPEDPTTLASMNNLATILYGQGNYIEAQKLQEETIAVKKCSLGPEHVDTLTSMNNLAETLRAQGDLARARALHEETLAVRSRVLGPEHPDTLQSMSGLAEALEDERDFAAARILKEQILILRRQTFGREHPETLAAMNNLSTVLFCAK